MSSEIFLSAVRSKGDIAGVFEFDGAVSYFYLYDLSNEQGKILSAIHMQSGVPDFSEAEIDICWNLNEHAVGLYIKGRLWAAFSSKGIKYGGNYEPGGDPNITAELESSF